MSAAAAAPPTGPNGSAKSTSRLKSTTFSAPDSFGNSLPRGDLLARPFHLLNAIGSLRAPAAAIAPRHGGGAFRSRLCFRGSMMARLDGLERGRDGPAAPAGRARHNW